MIDIAVERTETASKRRCRALNRHGKPCAARAVTEDQLCAAHGKVVDMKAIGRRGGMARKPGYRPLRDYLRERTDPEEVWQALRAALNSPRESDRLAAAKTLLAELYVSPPEEPERDDDEEFNPGNYTKAELKLFKQLLDKGYGRDGNGAA